MRDRPRRSGPERALGEARRPRQRGVDTSPPRAGTPGVTAPRPPGSRPPSTVAKALAATVIAALGTFGTFGTFGVIGGAASSTGTGSVSAAPARTASVPAGHIVRVHVPEAIGGKTVIGQLTVDNVTSRGYVIAYPCADGIPVDAQGNPARSDLNYNGAITPVASNRLIVQADAAGDLCFISRAAADLIVDVNAVSFDQGISSFPNRRTDTRRDGDRRPAHSTVRIRVPEAAGGKTVIGQLTVDGVTTRGYVTAYPCAAGVPRHGDGSTARSDLNYNGRVTPVASNRLIVQADADGDVCFTTSAAAHLVVDINGVSDDGIASFANRRRDTRRDGSGLGSNATLRIRVPEAADGKTVIGQLTVDNVTSRGYVVAYPCADGIPLDADGERDRSDLNYNGAVTPVASNRLIVQADTVGDICFTSRTPADLIVDLNAVSDPTAIFSFPNRRTDTRVDQLDTVPYATPIFDGMPVWPIYEPRPAMAGIHPLTGHPAAADDASVGAPAVAVKIDNYRLARPQWGLTQADVIFEVEVEGISRLVAVFQSQLPVEVGPVRSARTSDLDLLAGMNRPVFGFSGANPGVTAWIESADVAGVLSEFSALTHPCYRRVVDRPRPHNLSFDPACAADAAPEAGPGRSLWPFSDRWTRRTTTTDDETFSVSMPGVTVGWQWDDDRQQYLRFQDGQAHLTDGDVQLGVENVVVLSTIYTESIVDARSPHAFTTGSGSAVIHRNGTATPVTWSRPTPFQAFEFRDATGAEVPLDIGRTFVELERAP